VPPPPAHPRARALLDTWEDSLPRGWEIGRRLALGGFAAVVAHRDDGSREETGAIATDEGIVRDVAWSRLVSANRDIDGDGRDDLLLIRDQPPFSTPGDGAGRIEPAVVADRPGGPAVLPMEGLLPAHWTSIDFALGPGSAIELETGGIESGRQVFAWDGKALVARESAVVYVECKPRESTGNRDCTVVGSAHGKEKATSLEVTELASLGRGNLFDLAGDGRRFYLVRASQHAGPGNYVAELFGMVLEKSGWSVTPVPRFDLDTLKDRDGDGVPELEMDTSGVVVATTCPDEDDCRGTLTSPRALVMWDGARFSRRTPKLRGAYARWLVELRSALKPAGKGECPVEQVTFAEQAYLAARWAGANEAAALAAADAAMRGASLAACVASDTSVRTWAQIRRDIVAYARDSLPETASFAPSSLDQRQK
jgi:hypothetical protein